jgi:hypothetical protein
MKCGGELSTLSTGVAGGSGNYNGHSSGNGWSIFWVSDGVFSADTDGEAIFHPALELTRADFVAVQCRCAAAACAGWNGWRATARARRSARNGSAG